MKHPLLFLLFSLVASISQAQLPVASFTVDDSAFCPGYCTNFTNLSANATSYQWTFAGGSPSTSAIANPQNICYNTPGNYAVKLVATNANGSDTLDWVNCITVYPYPSPLNLTTSGDTIFAPQGYAHYQWYLETTLLPGDTMYYHVALYDGTHFLVAVDSNGCENGPASFMPFFVPDFFPSDTEFCSGSCIDFTNTSQFSSGDSAYITLQWYFNGAITTTSQAFSPQNICYSNPGSYMVKFIMLEGIDCRTDSFMVNVVPCTGIAERNYSSMNLSVLPNPFFSNVTLHFSELLNSKSNLKILNSIGETILEKEILVEDQTLDLSGLPQGIYLITITSGNKIYTQKIVK